MKTSENMTRRSGGVFVVVFAYAVVASLWILLSDRAMGVLFLDSEMLVQASMVKGWFFVAATSVLLYFLVRQLDDQIRRAYQREIEAHEERLRNLDLLNAIVENTDDAIFAKDLEGRYLLFNNAASHVIGKPVADVLGRDDRDVFSAEMADLVMESDRRVLASGQIETYENILDTAQGPRCFLVTKGPLRDAGKQLIGVFGISRDYTERKRIEVSLRESEERMRLLIEHVPVALAMFDRDMHYLAINQCWREDYKVGDRDVIGHSHYEIFPDLPEAWKEAHRRGLAGEVVSSDGEPFKLSDGRTVWARWVVLPWHTGDGGIGGIIIFAENITARREAERAMHDSERRFHDIVDISADWIWEVDAAGRYTFVSDSVRTLLGFAPAEILGKTPFDLMPPDEADRIHAKFQAIAARKTVFRDLDNINLHKDGSLRYVQTSGLPILAADGTLLGYRGLDRDVSERKGAEEELRQRNAELERFNRASVGREIDMIAMKAEINALSRELGRAPPYPLEFMNDTDTPT